jgi:preprotein translocase subunit SecD
MLLGILGGNLANPGHWHKQFKIGLGLDLSSGTQVSMLATNPDTGGPPTAAQMSDTVAVITARVNGTGVSGATVNTQGNDIITVSVPGKTGPQVVALVSTTAELNFRQVLLFQPYTGVTVKPSATAKPSTSATPSTGATPSTSATPSTGASDKASPSASATSTAKTTAKIVADPSPSANASVSPSASAHASTSPSASPSPSASSSSAASTSYGDSTLVQPAVMKLFNKLVCTPVAANQDQSAWKSQVGYTKAIDYNTLGSQTVGCDSSGDKYAMGVVSVQGRDVSGATADLSSTNGQWLVNLSFNGAGASAFGSLTTTLYNKYYASGGSGNPQDGNPDDYYLNTIAIVLDGNVVEAPENEQPVTTGQAQITGSFTQAQASSLANVLNYGSLPLTMKVQDQEQVSPTLGHSQLDAGLLAAAIGLILVVIYSFLYYRGLGLISISSLVIAALLGYLTIVLMSDHAGFTLDLAGIAGLIVAIGITADSFVVFFERLRDEVREGKQLRPAVEAGWKRARRTILVSDTVSFLCALLLYYFAISDVKGFAFTLGLTTVIDVLVVFTFTKPMMTLAARSKFFGSGHRLSGLDAKRLGARSPWRSSTRVTRTRSGATAAGRTSGEA